MILRGCDRLNPVLVRCGQQALRSKAFVWTYNLMLAALLVIALGFVQTGATGERSILEGRTGIAFLSSVIAGLAAAVTVVLPLSSMTRMANEARAGTLDLLSVTGLSAWRITWGYFETAAVQVLLFVALATPFLVFAYLFRGVGLGMIAQSLAWTTTAAFSANACALWLGSLRRIPWSARIASALLVVFIAPFLGVAMGAIGTTLLGATIGGCLSLGMLTLGFLVFMQANLRYERPLVATYETEVA